MIGPEVSEVCRSLHCGVYVKHRQRLRMNRVVVLIAAAAGFMVIIEDVHRGEISPRCPQIKH